MPKSESERSSAIAPASGSPDKRGTFLLVALVLFFGGVAYYTSAALADVVYRVLTDGPMLGAWILAGWGYGFSVYPGRSRGSVAGLVHVTRAALGLGVMSLLTLGLGLAGWLNQAVAIALLAVGFVTAVVALAWRRPGASEEPASEVISRWFAGRAGWHWALLFVIPCLVIIAAGGLVFPGILWGVDDPAGYDVVEYHLQVPREWYEMGRIAPLAHNVFSYFPFNVEMHYLLAMHLHGSPWAGMYLAQWMHGTFVVLTLAAVYAAGTSWGSVRGACAATVLAAGTPWMPMLGAVAYNEGGLMLYGTLAVAWLVRLLRGGGLRDASVAGAMAGLACGCKLTGVPMVLVAPVVAWAGVALLGRRTYAAPASVVPIDNVTRASRTHGPEPSPLPSPGVPGEGERGAGGHAGPHPTGAFREGGRLTISGLFARAGVYVLVGLVVFSPWLIRNQVWVGNPVYPEGMRVLGQGNFTDVQVERWERAHSPRSDQRGAGERVAEFGRQVVWDWRYAFAVLPLGLTAFVAMWRQREGWVIVGVLFALTAFWLCATHLQSRFFVLAIPLVGLTVTRLSGRWAIVALGVGVVATVVGFVPLHARFVPLSAAVGIDSPKVIREGLFRNPDLVRAMEEGRPLVLVGDAKAFWYDVPMTKLRYRTIFDVDAEGKGVVRAWVADAANLDQAVVVIDPGELDRFARTYWGIPALPPAWRRGEGSVVMELGDAKALKEWGRE